MKWLNVLTLRRYCSEWVWDKLLKHKVEANHHTNVFNNEWAGWWHEDLTWVMLGSCRQSWLVRCASLCQTFGTASGRCIMQLPRVCCPRHLRRANSAQAFADALRVNETITYVDLHGSEFGEELWALGCLWYWPFSCCRLYCGRGVVWSMICLDCGPIWWLVNLVCWIRRGNYRGKRGGCSHRFSLRFFRILRSKSSRLILD